MLLCCLTVGAAAVLHDKHDDKLIEWLPETLCWTCIFLEKGLWAITIRQLSVNWDHKLNTHVSHKYFTSDVTDANVV